jgi:hypothetical protein
VAQTLPGYLDAMNRQKPEDFVIGSKKIRRLASRSSLTTSAVIS